MQRQGRKCNIKVENVVKVENATSKYKMQHCDIEVENTKSGYKMQHYGQKYHQGRKCYTKVKNCNTVTSG